MIGRGLAAVLLALIVMSAMPAAWASAPAAGASAPVSGVSAPEKCTPQRGSTTVRESWAQRRLDFSRVWPLTKGAGVSVAVIDSGVDARHPQLRVAKEIDLTNTGKRDCVGHGTAVAGIIAGGHFKDIPFLGVAPEARLISIKQSNEEQGDVGVLARAIVEATKQGAKVINVSVQASNHSDLKAAVEYALASDVVVVAAAGNVRKEDGTPAPAFPAAYPGVLSVGSAAPDGKRADSSNATTPVSVLAPGQGITSTWTGMTYREDLDGTSFAAPYVTGVVALVRARYPELNNVRVRRRIELTSDGGRGAGTGAGMINPLLAVTALLPSEIVAVAPPVPEPLPAGAVSKAEAGDERVVNASAMIAIGAISAAGLVAVGGVVIPMGRRRGWRPGRRVVQRPTNID
ncbi:S8 family serine peptidase [Streptosporangium soli]|nr:S8 family serine peptidase [Streptosporangium sp. KLBMP 9127]